MHVPRIPYFEDSSYELVALIATLGTSESIYGCFKRHLNKMSFPRDDLVAIRRSFVRSFVQLNRGPCVCRVISVIFDSSPLETPTLDVRRRKHLRPGKVKKLFSRIFLNMLGSETASRVLFSRTSFFMKSHQVVCPSYVPSCTRVVVLLKSIRRLSIDSASSGVRDLGPMTECIITAGPQPGLDY